MNILVEMAFCSGMEIRDMHSGAPGADQMSFPGQRGRVSISQQVISPEGEEEGMEVEVVVEGTVVGSRVVAEEKALAMPCIRLEMFS